MSKSLRIVLITQGISRVVSPLLNSTHQIVGIIESAPRHYHKNKWLYQCIKQFCVIKEWLHKIPLTLSKLCHKLDVPYRFMSSSDDLGLSEWIRAQRPDIIVVFSMSQLLKEAIFTIPPLGTINLHPAYLPDYRGPNPDFWYYHDMALSPGVTVHYIDKGEDTGDIIYQDKIQIPMGIKSPERLDILIGKLGVTLLLKALDAIAHNAAPRTLQPSKSPTKRARNLVLTEHLDIIKWKDWPTERIWHILRGTEQWLNALPQPTGLYSGHRWIINDYSTSDSVCDKTPGKLYKEMGRDYVATRDGKIYLQLHLSLKTPLVYFAKKILS